MQVVYLLKGANTVSGLEPCTQFKLVVDELKSILSRAHCCCSRLGIEFIELSDNSATSLQNAIQQLTYHDQVKLNSWLILTEIIGKQCRSSYRNKPSEILMYG